MTSITSHADLTSMTSHVDKHVPTPYINIASVNIKSSKFIILWQSQFYYQPLVLTGSLIFQSEASISGLNGRNKVWDHSNQNLKVSKMVFDAFRQF